MESPMLHADNIDVSQYVIKGSDTKWAIAGSYEPSNTIKFFKDDKTIGVLDFDDGVMRFEGEADESAHIFFDAFANVFREKIHDVATEKAEQLFKDRIR